MSQQPPPPARPWFRLASLRMPPPPPPNGPSSNPQPEPVLAPVRPVIRPAFAQTFRLPPSQDPTPPPPQPPPVTTPPPPPQLPMNRVSPPPPPVTTPPLPPQQLPLNRVSPPPPPRSLPELTPSRSPPPSLQQLPLTRSSPPQPPQQRSLPSPPPSQPPLTRSSPPPSQPPPPRSSPPPSQPPPLRSSPPPPATPTSPVMKTSSPPNASSPSPPPPVQTTTTTTVTVRSPNPPSSPSPSSKIRHISHPPSPLTLPPAQLYPTEPQFMIPQEPEQKNVLVQQTTEKSKLTNGTSSNNTQHKYINGSTRNPPKVSKEDDKGNYKKSSDSEDYGMRIITIAGENKGAIMELNPLKKNNDNKNIPPRAWNSDGENSKKGYNNDYKPPSSYVNSNVQGINNSLIFNASCTHHDPGVHLSVSRNGNGGRGFHMKEKMPKD